MQIFAAARCFSASLFALPLYHFSTRAPLCQCAACSLAPFTFTATRSLFTAADAALDAVIAAAAPLRGKSFAFPFLPPATASHSCVCSLLPLFALVCCALLLRCCLCCCVAVCAQTCRFGRSASVTIASKKSKINKVGCSPRATRTAVSAVCKRFLIDPPVRGLGRCSRCLLPLPALPRLTVAECAMEQRGAAIASAR